MEEWKSIDLFEGLYEVSNLGNIRSLNYHRTGKITNMKQVHSYNNYMYVSFVKGGIKSTHTVHRIVSKAFITNHENKPHVNHKNGIKYDNRVENLEWCTHKENIIHSFKTLGRVGSRGNLGNTGGKNPLSKIVNRYSKELHFIDSYESLTIAVLSTGINHAAISQCCNGKRKTAGGFIWKYKE